MFVVREVVVTLACGIAIIHAFFTLVHWEAVQVEEEVLGHVVCILMEQCGA